MRLSATFGRIATRLSIGHFLGLLAISLFGSALWHGAEGVVFTAAIACAFVVGTLDRRDLFGLRAMTPRPGTGSRADLEAGLLDRHDALCLVIEIDSIAELRQRLGQRAIEDLLGQMSRRLRGCIRGGDGFGALATGRFGIRLAHSEGLCLEKAVNAALRLQACADAPLQADGLDVHLSLSVGFAHADRLDRLSPRPTLLAAAERALGAAQAAGPRSLRAFDADMMKMPPPPPSDRVGPDARALRRALENDEIVAWFQPQIDSETGRLTGVEALARWQHPRRGTLGPVDFLSQAAQAGLMGQLTDAMLDRALAQLARWDMSGLDVPRVSVNIGAEDLGDPLLVDRVRWALDRHEIAPGRLTIEILESVVATANPDDICARTILALARLGCSIDLDDFGTGSASIAGIRRFNVRRIKIDRSLVTALDRDRRQHAMVAAILTMADQLDVDVLAEGVETPAEHAALAELGVREVQGFAIARPLPGDQATAWIRRRAKTIATAIAEVGASALVADSLGDASRSQGHNASPGGETA